MTAERLGGDSLDRFGGPAAIPTQRHRPVPATQLDHHLGPRFVFERLQILEGQRLHRLEFVFGEMRATQDIGIDLEAGKDIAGEGSSPRIASATARPLVAIEAEIVEGQREGPAIAIAGARTIISERTDAVPILSAGS